MLLLKHMAYSKEITYKNEQYLEANWLPKCTFVHVIDIYQLPLVSTALLHVAW